MPEDPGRLRFLKRVRLLSYILYAAVIVLLSIFTGFALATAETNKDLTQVILLFTTLAFIGIAIGAYTLTVSMDNSLQ